MPSEARKSQTLKVPSEERIGEIIESNGFRKDVAMDDFSVACKAIRSSMMSGKGILMTGRCGCGKTFLMRILHKTCTHPKYWYSCSSDDSLWLLDPRQNRNIRDSYNEYPFIDDLGTEIKTEYGRRTDYVADYIRNFHDRAYETNGMRMFITTNLSSAEMLELYDERVLDRLMDMCVVLKFGGRSHRSREVVS